ncbi:hypothetical protein SRABI106_01331 [Rahnella aquatilis]|nr:hypothetical protein SRABI106_01331 [Rahnella aquatilis]
MVIPGLLKLTAPVRAMQNIIQRFDGFYHQEVANRRCLRRGDFALIHKAQFGKEIHGIFAGATDHSFHPFLTRHRLQGHRDQRSQPFVLYIWINRQKADRGFIIGIDI